MPTLVDSCVVLDILTQDERWFDWSYKALRKSAEAGPLIINPIIYAELSVRFSTIDALRTMLQENVLELHPITEEAAFLAGKCYLRYRRQGGKKSSPLPDFFIGAHAVTEKYPLLTRDSGRFSTYFPEVTLICP